MVVQDDVAGARSATAALLAHLGRIDLDAPSLLPGWSRAHVVAHLAGNARSHARMLDGCLTGEVVTQYPGGAEGRAAEIDSLAADPAAALAAHADACAALDQLWTALTAEQWERDVHRLDAGSQPATGLAWSRWREVEVHRVDLAAGYRPTDWDPTFAARLVQRLLARRDLPEMVVVAAGVNLPAAAERSGAGPDTAPGPRVSGSAAALAGWLTGRTDGSDLAVTGGALPHIPPWA